MKRLFMLVCGLFLLPGVAASADIYKWKDADGNVRYSDQPPPGKIPYETMANRKPAATNAEPKASGAADAKDKSATDKGQKQKAATDNQQKESQEKQDAQRIREQNCTAARSNLQSYKAGGRMVKFDENGERNYLSDQEIASGLANAEKDVSQWCD
jgi:hypothetical protein